MRHLVKEFTRDDRPHPQPAGGASGPVWLDHRNRASLCVRILGVMGPAAVVTIARRSGSDSRTAWIVHIIHLGCFDSCPISGR